MTDQRSDMRAIREVTLPMKLASTLKLSQIFWGEVSCHVRLGWNFAKIPCVLCVFAPQVFVKVLEYSKNISTKQIHDFDI